VKVDEVTVTEKRGILRVKVVVEGDEFVFGVSADGEVVLVSSVGNCLHSRRQVAFAIARGRLKAWVAPQAQESLPF
jgi:hypothetical protein